MMRMYPDVTWPYGSDPTGTVWSTWTDARSLV